MVGAQALAIHLNAVEELIQTEGDRNTSGHLEAIAQVVTALEVPVVAKETGAGIDRHTARRLASVGVAAIDVGGVGGTSFALIEGRRAEVAGDSRGRRLGDTFAGWGIPTAASVLEARDCGAQVVASGGVRTGLDAAKALALGADLVGVGRPLLMAALEGEERLEAEIELLLEELRVAMVLCGVSRPGDLRDLDPVVTGFTHEWRRQRGLG